ncbi:MAG: hypothetical protein KDB14_22110 [Planctomycetales bacterium]|nr:hypothetical protein [Planctomycetales bacterium]
MLIAMALLAMVAGGAAALSRAGNLASQQSQRWDREGRVSRVAIQRIRESISRANGSNQFPGVVVMPTTHGSKSFPDRLVVWRCINDAAPRDPQVPYTDELLFYLADPLAPHRLIESRIVALVQPAPPLYDSSAWGTLLQSAATPNASAEWVELNDALRVVATNIGGQPVHLPALRFHPYYAPSDVEFDDYASNLVPWTELAWPLGRASTASGCRMANIDIELQLGGPLMPTPVVAVGAASATFQVTP